MRKMQHRCEHTRKTEQTENQNPEHTLTKPMYKQAKTKDQTQKYNTRNPENKTQKVQNP